MLTSRYMRKVLVILLAVFMVSISGIVPFGANKVQAAVQVTYYVSTNGSDLNPGTEAQPFATITKARDVVRTINSNMTGDIIIYIRGGKYYLNSAISFNESDSGTNGYKVYYKNYPNETPEVVGGQKITGWTLDSGSIYKAYVGTGWTFHTLFENGVRSVKARYPNTGYLNTANGSGFLDQSTYLQAWLIFNAGDVPNWSDMIGGELNIWGYFDWHNSTLPIAAFDYANRKITLSRPPFWGITENPPAGSNYRENNTDRYFIQGVKSALDQPGEFYLNTSTGYLYYYPRSTPIADQEIVAPKMKNIFEFIGSSTTSLVKNIQFEGIKIRVSDFTNTYDAWADPNNPLTRGVNNSAAHYENLEPAANRWGNIYLKNAENITLHTLDIYNSGYSGIMLDRFCQRIAVFNSQIHDTGYNGVLITGANDNTIDPLVSKNNLIQNNNIYDIGKLVGHGSGITIQGSAYNRINHNEIHQGPRYGINIPGSYDIPATSSLALSKNNLVDYNRVYFLDNDSSDTGNIYQFASGRFNKYDHNLSQYSNGFLTNGVYYLDNHTDYTTLSNNIGHDPNYIVQNDNYPTNTLMNNSIIFDGASWAAAGLVTSQMGRSAMTGPDWSLPLDRTSWILTASSSYQADTPDKAVDGSSAARWTTGLQQAPGQWFKVDMRAQRKFNKIVLDTGSQSYNYPRGYEVYVSNDGTSWGSPVASGAGNGAVTDITFTPQLARYIKVVQTGSDSSWWWSVQEFNVYGLQPFDRTGYTVTSSSSYSSDTPDKAMDGLIGTRWTTGLQQAPGQWFKADMGSAKTFNKIVLDTGGDSYNYPRGYEVYVSNDGINWGSPVTSGTGNGTVTDITFTSQTARYIKIVQTGSDSNWWWSIQEFNIYDTSSALEPIPSPAPVPTPLGRTGWTATGSSSYSTDTPDKAIDADAASRWSTGLQQAPGQWFRVDMGSAKTFNRITLDVNWSSPNYPRGYEVYVSNDGTNWGSPVASGMGNQAFTDITFVSQTARYIKVVQTGSNNNGWWWSISDFNVYAP